MESTVFYKTQSGNRYLYDNNNSMFMTAHPLFEYFYRCEKTGMDDFSNDDSFELQCDIPGKNTYSQQEIEYYYEKYQFLKIHGLFGVLTNRQRIMKDINPEMIGYYLANIKQITFEVTECCNLNCTYCTYNDLFLESEKRENKFLSIKTAKTIIDYFFSYWDSRLNQIEDQTVAISFYGGEPLLNFDFIRDVIQYLQYRTGEKKKFRFTITTNGLLLDKHIDYLIEHDFKITVSLDGNYENNQYRIDHNNNNPHNKILTVLKKIMKEYPEFYKTNVRYNTVLHDKNSVEEVFDFFMNELNKTTKFLEVNSDGAKPERLAEIEKMHSTFLESYFNFPSRDKMNEIDWDLHINNQIINCLRGYWSNYIRSYKNLFYDKTEQKKLITGTCTPFWKKMFITAKGLILPCERIDFKYALGKIENNEVKLNFDKVADKFNRYLHNVSDQCNECYISRSCSQCMFYIDGIENEPNCDSAYNRDAFSKYLSYIYTEMEDAPEKVFNLLKKTLFE